MRLNTQTVSCSWRIEMKFRTLRLLALLITLMLFLGCTTDLVDHSSRGLEYQKSSSSEK